MRFRFIPFVLQALACVVLFCALVHSRPVDKTSLSSFSSRAETPAKDYVLLLYRKTIIGGTEHWGLVVTKLPVIPGTFVEGTLMHAVSETDKKTIPLKTTEKGWRVYIRNGGRLDPENSTKLAELTEAESQEAIAKLKAVHLTELPTRVGGNCIDYVRLGAKALVTAGLMKENTKLNELTNPKGAVYQVVRKAVWGQ